MAKPLTPATVLTASQFSLFCTACGDSLPPMLVGHLGPGVQHPAPAPNMAMTTMLTSANRSMRSASAPAESSASTVSSSSDSTKLMPMTTRITRIDGRDPPERQAARAAGEDGPERGEGRDGEEDHRHDLGHHDRERHEADEHDHHQRRGHREDRTEQSLAAGVVVEVGLVLAAGHLHRVAGRVAVAPRPERPRCGRGCARHAVGMSDAAPVEVVVGVLDEGLVELGLQRLEDGVGVEGVVGRRFARAGRQQCARHRAHRVERAVEVARRVGQQDGGQRGHDDRRRQLAAGQGELAPQHLQAGPGDGVEPRQLGQAEGADHVLLVRLGDRDRRAAEPLVDAEGVGPLDDPQRGGRGAAGALVGQVGEGAVDLAADVVPGALVAADVVVRAGERCPSSRRGRSPRRAVILAEPSVGWQGLLTAESPTSSSSASRSRRASSRSSGSSGSTAGVPDGRSGSWSSSSPAAGSSAGSSGPAPCGPSRSGRPGSRGRGWPATGCARPAAAARAGRHGRRAHRRAASPRPSAVPAPEGVAQGGPAPSPGPLAGGRGRHRATIARFAPCRPPRGRARAPPRRARPRRRARHRRRRPLVEAVVEVEAAGGNVDARRSQARRRRRPRRAV